MDLENHYLKISTQELINLGHGLINHLRQTGMPENAALVNEMVRRIDQFVPEISGD